MASEIAFIVEESPEGGYEAKAVGHSVFTEAETLDELKSKIQDAVRCHFGPSPGSGLAMRHQPQAIPGESEYCTARPDPVLPLQDLTLYFPR